MSNDKKEILPIDLGSDFSLPGRFEDSNNVYPEAPFVKPKSKNRGIWIMGLAFLIVASGFFSYYFMNQNEIDSKIIQNSLIADPEKKLAHQYNVGKYGSDHAHAAIMVFVNNESLNFGQSQFQLSSKYIHFENNNSYILHKHATGVPMDMLFASLAMKVTQECVVLNYYSEKNTGEFCTNPEKSLSFYVNGKKYNSNLSQYVFDHNDRILISYGDSESIPFQLEFLNSLEIFDVPKKTPQYSGDGITI